MTNSKVKYCARQPRKEATIIIAWDHAREKQLLIGYIGTVVIYAFSEHKALHYATCIFCIYPLIFGFYHAFGIGA